MGVVVAVDEQHVVDDGFASFWGGGREISHNSGHSTIIAGMRKPLLAYDGDCGFCRRWIARWRAATGDAVDYEPFETVAARHKDVPRETFQGAVQWFGPGGERAQGARAVFLALSRGPGRGWPLWAYRRVPGFAAVSEAAYRLVASRRVLFSRLDRLLWGTAAEPPSHRAAFWLMLRLLGLVHLAAFASLWVQAAGLWGRAGILPVAGYLDAARAQLGGQAFRAIPSVFWLGSSDAALNGACAAGVALSLLVALGLAVGPALFGLWALSLSFLAVGQDFLSFQWDILLLEVTFLACLCAPWRPRPRLPRWAPPAAGLWLLRLLLFRLMFESGAVKLLSGDPTWRNLTALTFHYETQPLPTWVAWYANLLPLWFQKLSCGILFVAELGLPWLIVLPRRPRLVAFFGLGTLMVLIAVTGNYCFFNLLGLLLCLTLLDDRTLGRWAARLAPALDGAPSPRRWAWPAFALVGLLSALQLANFVRPRILRPILALAGPLRLVNGYGLFAIMTTTRPEIILEGSADGREWKEYEFKWKPGDLARRPRFVAPHQPRLDWQMWFAALGDYRENEWFMRFLARLLEGSKPVSALLARDPFAGGPPPRLIRATVYRYRFTRPGQPGWWTRERVGPYCPVVSL
jgi:predicted DCC family thiol-disulfide oxidoreductase YuxK